MNYMPNNDKIEDGSAFAGIDQQWLRAWKSITFCDAPLKKTLWAALCASYAADERVIVKNKAGTLHNHNIDAAITRIVDASKDYPNLTRLTYQSPDIARGQIFHQICAGTSARKHAKSELQSTHDLRVTEECITFYIKHFKRSPSPNTVLGWLFHDLVEDHGVTLEEITSYSNASVAKAVKPVSIPPLTELQSMYPELASTGKMALKHHFKEDMVRTYTIDNVILKFFDGLDAFNSYINEMNNRSIFITNTVGQERPKADPCTFSLQSMRENLGYRRDGNQQLMDRCIAINDDPQLNPHKFDYTALIPVFENKFHMAAKEFETRLMLSAAAYDKMKFYTYSLPITARVKHLKGYLVAKNIFASIILKRGVRTGTAGVTRLANAFSTFVL